MYCVYNLKIFNTYETIERFEVDENEARELFFTKMYHGTDDITLEDFLEEYKDSPTCNLKYYMDWYGPCGYDHFIWITKNDENVMFNVSRKFLYDSGHFEREGITLTSD